MFCNRKQYRAHLPTRNDLICGCAGESKVSLPSFVAGALPNERLGRVLQSYYNATVLDYNNQQGEFPDLIVARVTGFTPLSMLQATENAAERQAVRIQMQ